MTERHGATLAGRRSTVEVTRVRRHSGAVVSLSGFLGDPAVVCARGGRGHEVARELTDGSVWVAMEAVPGAEGGGEALYRRGGEPGPHRGRGPVRWQRKSWEQIIQFCVRLRLPDLPVEGAAPAESSETPALRRAGEARPVDPESETVDSRVLRIVYDEQGERSRPWRDAMPALVADGNWDWPVEGPRTVMRVVEQFSRSNLGPQQWRGSWQRRVGRTPMGRCTS